MFRTRRNASASAIRRLITAGDQGEGKTVFARVLKVLRDETGAHAAGTVVVLAVRSLFRRLNATTVGWRDGRLPIRSRIVGSKHICVGNGFRAQEPVIFVAVTEYAGVRYDPMIVIGRNFRSSGRVHMSAIDRITIGDDCLLGSNIFIADHSHGNYRDGSGSHSSPLSTPVGRELISRGTVAIGDRCWLGDNVVILQGVSIGPGSVVGANTVVTRDVPADSMVAGAPARVIRVFSAATGKWSTVRGD